MPDARTKLELLRRAHAGRERQVAILRARLVDLGASLETALHDASGHAREAAAQRERAEYAERAAVAERQRADALEAQVARQIAMPPRARMRRLLGRWGKRRS